MSDKTELLARLSEVCVARGGCGCWCAADSRCDMVELEALLNTRNTTSPPVDEPDEAKGGSACPHCGRSELHHHTPDKIARLGRWNEGAKARRAANELAAPQAAPVGDEAVERLAQQFYEAVLKPSPLATQVPWEEAQSITEFSPFIADCRRFAQIALVSTTKRLREVLINIDRGTDNAFELFKRRMGPRKQPTWYAVNVLQEYLEAAQGTARQALSLIEGPIS